MTKLPCDIIQDLLPSYADGLTSPASSEAIEAHLVECPTCAAAYAAMQTGNIEDVKGSEGSGSEGFPEIDYLKKIRSTNRKRILIAAVLVLLLSGFGVWAKVYLYGSPIEDFHLLVTNDADSRVVKTETFTDQNGETRTFSHATSETLVFNCWIEESSGQAFSHYKLKETDDGLDVIVYAVPFSRFHQMRTLQIKVPVSYDEDGKNVNPTAVNIKGDTYNSYGLITKKAKKLYAARNPYIGDISADLRLANLLGIGEAIGSYTNKLNTQESEGFEYPYSWELIFDRPWTDGYDKIYNRKMRSYAYVLLALIDNCGEIKWTYQTEDGIRYTKSINLADWRAEYPSDDVSPGFRIELKDYAAYDYRIQSLLTKLDIG